LRKLHQTNDDCEHNVHSLHRGGASDGPVQQHFSAEQCAGSEETLPLPYTVRGSDLKNGILTLMPGTYNAVWPQGNNVPECVRQHMSAELCSVKTNGNGACAIHSIFGRPAALSELFLPDARRKATHALCTLPAIADNNETAKDLFISLCANLWVEFAVPHLEGRPSIETEAFWSSLERQSPGLAVEARKCYIDRPVLERRKNNLKAVAVTASRQFFNAEDECQRVRPLAIKMGFVPASMEGHMVDGRVCVSGASLQSDGQWEGLQQARGDDGFIKGTRIVFPFDGPSCKYEALFDGRPEFDALREGFMTYAPQSSPRQFLGLAQESCVDVRHTSFLRSLTSWVECPTPLREPLEFGPRAWEAYMTCMNHKDFYMSADELIATCLVAKVNVAVFEQQGKVLEYAGGFFDAPGAVTCCKLSSNRLQRIRSHFERVLTTTELQEIIQEQHRDAEDARMAEEAQDVADEGAASDVDEESRGGSGGQSSSHPSHPPPPAPHESARPRKRLRSKTGAAQYVGCGHDITSKLTETLDNMRAHAEQKLQALAAQQKTQEQQFFNIQALVGGPDKRCKLEVATQNLAEMLREEPTIPADVDDPELPCKIALLEDAAVELPLKHCAFKGCLWQGSKQAQQMEHLRENHRAALDTVVTLMHPSHSYEEKIEAAYNAAITHKVQQGAPLACYALDRRSVRNYVSNLSDDNVESLVCFCCARRFPHVSSISRNEIKWVTPCDEPSLFFGLSHTQAEKILGFEAYMTKYGHCSGSGMPNLNQWREEFEDFVLDVTIDGKSLRLLCCPEDLQCDSAECQKNASRCGQCRVPMCSECTNSLEKKVMPPAALTNDMMVFYAPVELYTLNVTVVEMVCASVCITSMICSTLEMKHRKENPFDTTVHMANHRMGARGNATSFPLPWSSLLAELQRLDEKEEAKASPDLPWTGAELSDKISILIKTHDEHDTLSMAQFVHQALVRRDVVLQLIQGAKNRGHRAYANVNMERAYAKAQSLPENGVPPELIRIIPHDDHLDKVLVQKAGTPVGGRSDLEGAGHELATTKPNAVVMEKSSYDDADINAQRIRVLHHYAEQLDVQVSQDIGDTVEHDRKQVNAAKRRKSVGLWNKFTSTTGVESPAEFANDTKEESQDIGDQQRVGKYVAATGNELVSQFNSWYFGIAFAFLFKFCTAMPDMPKYAEKVRYRRTGDAPRVEPPFWVRVMSRRIEAQLQRDWQFGFVTWNYIFRSAVNLSRTLYSYEKASTSEGTRAFTAQELEQGAIHLCKALHGTYLDPGGRKQSVKGDMTKLRHVPGLSDAAKRLLQNIEHVSRKIPGTQEIRRLMRFDLQGYRVRYGVPIFVTFSPDEPNNVLMLRLSRTRRNDPVFAENRDIVGQRLASLHFPTLDGDYAKDLYMDVPVGDLAEFIPNHDQRRIALARDSLASVDGFRILVLAAFKFLFWMNVCFHCPDCNTDKSMFPCQDVFGCSSTPEGGFAGRAEAVFTSIEAQKATGSLHGHSQLFVQCLHQHMPLIKVFEFLKKGNAEVVRKYLRYKTHVCRQVYADKDLAEKRLPEQEAAWPQYKESKVLISRPSYLTTSDGCDTSSLDINSRDTGCSLGESAESKNGFVARKIQKGREWLQQFLDHVQQIQEMKQHHIHLPNEKGEKVPLTHCRRPDDPTKCKSDFPRTSWLIEEAVVLCRGLLERMGLASTGRRSKLGSLHGPMNHESLNGSANALLAVQQFNSDVQLPYRFPLCDATHSQQCDEECLQDFDEADEIAMVYATQFAQDAQCGYACDYCSKRQPMAFNEVKECCKGQQNLSASLTRKGDIKT